MKTTLTTTTVPAVTDAERVCSCGQLLDCSHTDHCPRCGVRLAAG
jgi:hypothetical protein